MKDKAVETFHNKQHHPNIDSSSTIDSETVYEQGNPSNTRIARTGNNVD